MRGERVALALRVSVPLLRNALVRPNFGADAPLVSVVIATFNWSGVLKHALRSALWQTYPNVEVLVVGDGCTDDSAEVVGSFADPRVSWRNLAANSGSQSVPNNAGLVEARGAYVAYLGHDDLWLPNHLSLLVGEALRTGADLVHSVSEMLGPPGSRLRALSGVRRYRPGDALPPSTWLHRRSLAAELGGWVDYRTIVEPPDVDFLHRAYDAGASIRGIRALTVVKFNSAWRPRSYIEKPTHEQARYVRRIESERGFVVRELASAAGARLLGPIRLPEFPEPPDPLPPGWWVTEYRRARGLEQSREAE
jgi:glycosyltransferase involved in cell wall biosynthesis